MSLHIVLGFDSPKATAAVSVVYAGRSGEEARAAMAKSTAHTFGILQNPQPLRKNNPRASANRAALDPEAQKAAALATEQARLEAEGKAAELREASRVKATAIAKAQGVAQAAVNVVKDAVLQFANEVSAPAELAAAQARADTEAGPETPPPSAEPSAPESSAASGDEPENHFAAPPPRRAKRS